jgi:hypothetical protein
MTDVRRLKSPVWQRRALPFLAVLSSLATPVYSSAQSSQTFSGIGRALDAIRQTYSVCSGFKNVKSDSDKTPVILDLSGGDVARVFDALVAQRTAYAWSLNNGFYNVYPKLKNDSISQMKVANYTLTNATHIEAVIAVEKLPEIQKWSSRQHVSMGSFTAGSRLSTPGIPSQPHRESFVLKDTSIRSVLNQVYRSFGETQWTIWHDGQRVTLFVPL